jgi:hypothetical protein
MRFAISLRQTRRRENGGRERFVASDNAADEDPSSAASLDATDEPNGAPPLVGAAPGLRIEGGALRPWLREGVLTGGVDDAARGLNEDLPHGARYVFANREPAVEEPAKERELFLRRDLKRIAEPERGQRTARVLVAVLEGP